MSESSSHDRLWEKQSPSRIRKPEAVKPAPKPAAKKAAAKKK